MSDYKSTRSPESENPGETQSFASAMHEQKEQEKESSKKTAKVAAKGAAMYFGGPEAGAAVDMAANTKAGEKILNKGGEALNKVPGVGKASKKLDDAGVLDKADQALSLAGSAGGGAGAANGAANGAAASGGAASAQTAANTTEAAKASSGAANQGGSSSSGGDSSFFDNIKDKKKKDSNKDENGEEKERESVLEGKVKIPMAVKMAVLSAVPFILLIVLILIIITAIGGAINDFTDAVSISKYFDLPTGDNSAENISDDAKKFIERVKEVKDEYEKNEKTVDPLLVMAVYHVANYHNKDIDYNYMTKARIRAVAAAMFTENSTSYSEEAFRKECVKVNRKIATRLYKDGELNPGVASI